MNNYRRWTSEEEQYIRGHWKAQSESEMAAALGISRAGAYELVRTEGFPALKIGSRIVIPKDELQEWVKRNTGVS